MQNFVQVGAKQQQDQNQIIKFRQKGSICTKKRYSFRKMVRNTNDIRLRSYSKGTKSTYSEEIHRFSKFYVKNFFQKSNKIQGSCKKLQTQQNINLKLKLLQALNNKQQNNTLNIHSSKSQSNLQIIFIKAKSEQFNEPDKVQQFDSQLARSDLKEQYHKQKEKLKQIKQKGQSKYDKKYMEKLQSQNNQMKIQLQFYKSSKNQTNDHLQLKKALLKIQKLQKQLIYTKKQLFNSILIVALYEEEIRESIIYEIGQTTQNIVNQPQIQIAYQSSLLAERLSFLGDQLLKRQNSSGSKKAQQKLLSLKRQL